MSQPKLPTVPDREHLALVRKQAHRAMCSDLKDYPWIETDPKLVRKVHTMLPFPIKKAS